MARRRRRQQGLERVLGTPALFATAYGNVGSSIYYALGLVAGIALGLTPLVFVISGLIFAATAASYAEGTVRYPEAGGSSSFARHAFNELVSFGAAWGQMLNYVITLAIPVGMIAYTGIETVSNLAEEARDPVRSIPRAISWVAIAVFAIYFTLPFIALSAMPVHRRGSEFVTQLGQEPPRG